MNFSRQRESVLRVLCRENGRECAENACHLFFIYDNHRNYLYDEKEIKKL